MITDLDKYLFVERFIRDCYVFHGDYILETDPTGQGTDEKSEAAFLDMNSLYLSAMSHYSFCLGITNSWTILLIQFFFVIATVE